MTIYWAREVTAGTAERDSGAAGMARGCSLLIEQCLGTVVVTLQGVLTGASSAHVAGVLTGLIEGQGNLTLALDLRGLRGIDSSGLEVLSAAASSLERRGGALRLCRPASAVLEALRLVGLARLVTPPEHQHLTARPPRTIAGTRPTWTAAHPAGSGVPHRAGWRYR